MCANRQTKVLSLHFLYKMPNFVQALNIVKARRRIPTHTYVEAFKGSELYKEAMRVMKGSPERKSASKSASKKRSSAAKKPAAKKPAAKKPAAKSGMHRFSPSGFVGTMLAADLRRLKGGRRSAGSLKRSAGRRSAGSRKRSAGKW